MFAVLAGSAIALGCTGPDEFFRLSDAGEPAGTAGSSPAGVAGTSGAAGAGAGAAGSGGAPTGIAGTTGSGGGGGSVSPAGTGGDGGSIAGTAGASGSGGGGGATGGSATAGATGSGGASGAAGTGGRGGTTGGTGGAGTAGTTGAAGTTGSAGRAGTTGSAGASGAGGRGGTTGTAGAGGTGGATATGGTGGRGPDRIQVVAQCQSTNGAQDIRVTFKILNPDSVAKQWSDIKVRYYYTAMTGLPAMVKFDFLKKFTTAQLTTNATSTYVEVGFTTGAGMIAGFDNVTGSDEIQLHLYNYSSPTWNSSQMDDYSYASCSGVSNTSAYTDRLTMPGYYQGQLAWGSEPPL